MSRPRGLYAIAVLLVVASSCSQQRVDSLATRTADDFNALIGRDMGVDYEPLSSPSEARSVADLIVVGRVLGVEAGMTITAPHNPIVVELDEEADSLPELDRPDLADIPTEVNVGSYVTVLLEVDRVISGAGAEVGDVLPIQLDRSPVTATDDLVSVAPVGPAVFILDDVTDWKPRPDAVFDKPERLERAVSMFIPYTDGVWFETVDGVGRPFVRSGELPEAWGNPQSVGDIVASLRAG